VRILLVEDNPKMVTAIAKGLMGQGYEVDAFDRGTDGEKAAVTNAYDVIILDRILPDRDGVDLCVSLRQQGVKTPVLMLTGLSERAEVLVGLNAGANDYLAKPFELNELLSRLRDLIHSSAVPESSVLRFADLELDLVKRAVKRQGAAIDLSAQEFALLEYLVRHSNRLVTSAQIDEHVWGMALGASSNVVEVYVAALNRKLGKPLIHARPDGGYVLSESPGS
jgi:two-component system, OmpR family, copper resistance phosphate regulon response regulator CusR